MDKKRPVIAVHQPQYLPWLGYFDKIARSDLFVFLDNVQYKKREFQNRNRIKTPNGSLWLTVPVQVKGKYFQPIRGVEIDNTSNWAEKHWRTIRQFYSHAPHFAMFSDFFDDLYSQEWNYLSDLSMEIITYVMDFLEIKHEIIMESDFNPDGTSTERIISICKHFNAGEYLSGSGGKAYMDEDRFAEEKISLSYQVYDHPVYPQQYGDFISHLSVIDLLFNCGRDSARYVLSNRQTV